MTELLWIAVPGGQLRPDGRAPVSIVIVPRLAGGGDDLASHGVDHWPEVLHGTRLEIAARTPAGEVAPVEAEPAFTAPVATMLADWQALFGEDEDGRVGGAVVTAAVGGSRFESTEIDLVETSAEAAQLRSLYSTELAGESLPLALAALEPLARRRRDAMARRQLLDVSHRDSSPREFHRMVAYFRDHPRVLRALGLIVDVAVALPAGVEAVRILPQLPAWPAGPPPVLTRPWTRCSIADGRLRATPRPGSMLRSGLVDLTGAGPVGGSASTTWSVLTFDVDAAMTHLPGDGDAEPRLAGLRSAGLGLVRSRRASDLRARLDRRPAGSADGAELHADDLLLGYRLDVRDDGPVGELLPAVPPWRSLCSRRSRYEISGRALDGGDGFIREEGQLKPDAMVAVAGGLGGDEVVARWDGWSLAVARPSPTGNGTAPRPATELAWRFAVVPPLPALRFGREYRLRIRAADLAGGGLSVADLDGDASASLATRPIAYGRVEPVPAPVLLSEIELGPGEGAERLVVRSLGGPPPEPPDPKIPQEFLPPPARVVDPYPPIRRRRFAAPPVSVELAEQHGLFDELSPEASWELARRAMPLLIGDDSPGPDPALPRWLPDPLAHRWVARLTGVGSASAEWAPAGTEAHVLAPAVLEVRRGEMTAVLQAGGTVTVTLPPAGEAVVELSSAPAEEDLAQLALPGWPSDPTVAMQVLDAVRQGRQAHVTPARQVQLVHAVQRPLAVPRGSVGVHRAPGDTTVTVTRLDSIVIDRASTARLDVTAQWREWGDAPAAIDTRSAPVASVTIPSSGLHPAQARHEMGDTRRRTIAYTATVVSRFQEYFDQALLAADPGAFTVVGPAMVVDVPSSARPPAPAVRAVVPAFRWEGGPPVAGWQEWRHVRRGGIVRIHMAPGWFASGEGELLGVVASTEPFPPRVSWAFLSQAGRDPARVTPDAVHWITPAEAGPLAGPPAVQTLPEAGRRVAVLPFAPWPDPDGGWIADVDLGPLANSSYMPFVDLALCRYQPVSVDGHHLSQVVRSDFLQLLPDRTLTVRRESSLVTVTLAGLGPGGQLPNQVEVWIEAWRGPAGGAVNSLPGDLTMLDAASDVEAWQRVAGPARGGLGQAVAIPVPSENGPRRVVVREIEPERFGVDTPGPAATVAELRRRVVFVDVVQLL